MRGASRVWCVTFGPEGERARDISAQGFEEREVVAFRDAEGPGNRIALRFLRQEPREERAALALLEGLRSFTGPAGEVQRNSRSGK